MERALLEEYVGVYRSIGHVCQVRRERDRLCFAARYSDEVTRQLTETPDEIPEAPPPFRVESCPAEGIATSSPRDPRKAGRAVSGAARAGVSFPFTATAGSCGACLTRERGLGLLPVVPEPPESTACPKH